MTVKITQGKFERLNACANQRGVFAALAVDHRWNLLQAIAESRGPGGQATPADMLAFKTAVVQELTPYASAILLDTEYGLGAIPSRAPGTGVMLAYEKSSYYVSDRLTAGAGRTQSVAGRNEITKDFATQGRLPDLLPEQSVRRLLETGAQAIKILMYYNPFDSARIISIKQAYVERIGAECAALEVPFFLEPLAYDDTLGDERGSVFARKKPEYVLRAIEEFSRPRYGVDVLKVEIPVNPIYVSGTRAFKNEAAAYTRHEAINYFRATDSASSLPLIYLSAGATDEVFCEMLELAAEAGATFSGVLCGRATWQDGIAIYGTQGDAALRSWLADRGARNILALNTILASAATPWWDIYGGRDNISFF